MGPACFGKLSEQGDCVIIQAPILRRGVSKPYFLRHVLRAGSLSADSNKRLLKNEAEIVPPLLGRPDGVRLVRVMPGKAGLNVRADMVGSGLNFRRIPA